MRRGNIDSDGIAGGPIGYILPAGAVGPQGSLPEGLWGGARTVRASGAVRRGFRGGEGGNRVDGDRN